MLAGLALDQQSIMRAKVEQISDKEKRCCSMVAVFRPKRFVTKISLAHVWEVARAQKAKDGVAWAWCPCSNPHRSNCFDVASREFTVLAARAYMQRGSGHYQISRGRFFLPATKPPPLLLARTAPRSDTLPPSISFRRPAWERLPSVDFPALP